MAFSCSHDYDSLECVGDPTIARIPIPAPLQSALEESREDRLCIETENSGKFEKQKDSIHVMMHKKRLNEANTLAK
jgi:hypothetical protein